MRMFEQKYDRHSEAKDRLWIVENRWEGNGGTHECKLYSIQGKVAVFFLHSDSSSIESETKYLP